VNHHREGRERRNGKKKTIHSLKRGVNQENASGGYRKKVQGQEKRQACSTEIVHVHLEKGGKIGRRVDQVSSRTENASARKEKENGSRKLPSLKRDRFAEKNAARPSRGKAHRAQRIHVRRKLHGID